VTTSDKNLSASACAPKWDHSSHDRFYDYYAAQSAGENAQQHFRRIQNCILRIVADGKSSNRALEVADIGCGAGAQSIIWAEAGHRVHALDVNQPLIELGRKRATSAGHTIDFRVGSATDLPWADSSMDVCISLELLEHVTDWQSCLREYMRVLRPGGILYFTTTNGLCPLQAEFNLPLYSWYPGPVKRHFEKLATTTRPDLANFASYPAVHWFNFYGLRSRMARNGFRCLDRFDLIDLENKSVLARFMVSAVRSSSIIKFFAHVCTPATIILAIKNA
jgi:2-polyprenyl-3-methyl-5-hydroxy-6-metoxy-1,4-benzoquinol methylase